MGCKSLSHGDQLVDAGLETSCFLSCRHGTMTLKTIKEKALVSGKEELWRLKPQSKEHLI